MQIWSGLVRTGPEVLIKTRFEGIGERSQLCGVTQFDEEADEDSSGGAAAAESDGPGSAEC